MKVILASGRVPVLERLGQILAESETIELVQTVRDAGAVDDALLRYPEVDVLVIDEAIDGGRGHSLLRTTGAANPLLGVVMLVDQAGPDQFAAAMDSGARAVITTSASLAEVTARLEGVAQWVVAARNAVSADTTGGRGGKVVAVAGAKGGVGASVMSLLVAHAGLGAQTVAVVDFDLQSGDLAAYLGVHTRRSVVDLVDVAGEITGRVLREASYDVPGGLRLLSAPNDGERAEAMTARAARSIVSGLRFQYDLSVIDVGSHLTESTAVVLEEADVALLVATPDLPALRSARRMLTMWERLVIRSRTAVEVVLNRQNRRNEVTETLAAKILETPIRATIPDGGTAFESAMNTANMLSSGGPTHAAAQKLLGALQQSATREQSVDEAVEEAVAAGRSRRKGRREAGQAAVEMPVVVAMALTVFLVCAQGLAWSAGFLMAREAATEAARVISLSGWSPSTVIAAEREARDNLSGPWRRDVQIDVRRDEVTVAVLTPVVWPGADWRASASATVPRER